MIFNGDFVDRGSFSCEVGIRCVRSFCGVKECEVIHLLFEINMFFLV